MYNSLLMLILDDLSQMATKLNAVPSMHLINLIFNAYTRTIAPTIGEIIQCNSNSDPIYNKVNSLLSEHQQLGTRLKTQILIENGIRRNSSIHYFGIHVEIANNQINMLVIDHANGFEVALTSLRNKFAAQGTKLNYFVLGGEKLQKDFFTCGIFAMSSLHALSTEEDVFTELQPNRTELTGNVDWLHAPYQLVWNAQTLTFLYKYADHYRDRTTSLLPDAFAEYITNGINITDDNRAANDSIKKNAAKHLAGITASLLINKDEHNIADLLYLPLLPNLCSLTKSILNHHAELGHPLIEYLYQHAESMESHLKNEKLAGILSQPEFLNLILLLKDDGINKIMSLFFNAGDLNTSSINKIFNNIKAITLLNNYIETQASLRNLQQVRPLLLCSNAYGLLSNTVIKNLIKKQRLDLMDVSSIILFLVNKENRLAQINDESEQSNYLLSPRINPSHPRNKRNPNSLFGGGNGAGNLLGDVTNFSARLGNKQ